MVLGLFIFKTYGLSWDEKFSRDNGLYAYNYVTGKNTDLLQAGEKEYGTAFELPLVWIEKTINLTSTQQIYYMRHLVTFSFFFVGVIFFYLLSKKRFGAKLGLLGTFFLILSPRIFADSFYNSKDVILLASIIIAVFTLKRFLDRKTLKNALIHSIICAYAVGVRMPALIIVLFTFAFLAYDFVFSSNKNPRIYLKAVILFTFSFIIFTVLFWPYLWVNPFWNFLSAYSKFSHFGWNNTLLYFGRFVPVVSEFHKTYPLVWIGMTTPLSYLALFFIGVAISALSFAKKPVKYLKTHRDDLIFLCWFFVPLLSIILLKSVIYDGWRHLYFIYPAMILIGLVGFERVLKSKFRSSVSLLIFIDLLFALIFMVKYHPYQNLYFNLFSGGMKNVKNNFEMDYWGLTFRRGLEYIAQNDKSEKIPIFFAHGLTENTDILKDDDRKRFIVLKEPRDAKYVLSNYRWHPENYPKDIKIIYEIKIEGVSIMSVLKRPPEGFKNETFERR